MLRFVVTLIAALDLACSTTSAVIEKDIYPDIALSKTDPIVVKDFHGKRGNEVSNLIENALFKKGFTVVDRRNLFENAIAGEKLNPAKYVISGNVEDYSMSRDIKHDPATCSNVQDGKTVETYGTRYSYRYVGRIIANVRFSNPKTSEIAVAKKIAGTSEMNIEEITCVRYRETNFPTQDQMLDPASQEFEREFLKIVEPYRESFEVTLFKVDEQTLPEVKIGHEFLKSQNLEQALSQYKIAVEKAEKHGLSNEIRGHALYAYGLALSFHGEIDAGTELMGKAYSLHPEIRYILEKGRLEKYRNKFMNKKTN